MLHNRFLFLFIVATVSFLVFAFTTQPNPDHYPQDYFRSPVNTPIKLSGTFGELRSNHLHAGIDIKAHNGQTGQPILAAAEGYVSRIKVQSGGYGNVLYINHPNGYTTVYAHLANFPKAVADYVKAAQKKERKFEIQLYPPAGKFTVAKGEELGKMGLSGRSYGPHLHFEIRDTKTEKPINPLLFGLKAKDHLAPKLHQVKIYSLNDKYETLDTKTLNVKKGSKGYRVSGDTVLVGAWRIGIGLKAYDHMSLAPNWNGVYKIQMYKDDQPVYGFTMEKFPFSESRYINAHLDYEEQVSEKAYINRFYKLPGNRLSIYDAMIDNGIVEISKTVPINIRFVAEDVAGNTSELSFWVRRDEVPEPPSRSFNYLLPYQEAHQIDNGAFALEMPKGTLYENLYLQYNAVDEESDHVYSPIHHVHDYKTPVHKYYRLWIAPTNLPTDLRDKAFIAYCQPDNTIITCGGKWENGRLTTKVRDLGDFSIMTDTEPPTVQPKRFRANMQGYRRMSFTVKDNFKTAPNIDPIRYDAYLDGEWILMEYDAKNDLLTHWFEPDLPKGEHRLKLVVADDRGNETVLERQFKR